MMMLQCHNLYMLPRNILFTLLEDSAGNRDTEPCVMTKKKIYWAKEIQGKMSGSAEGPGEVWHLWGSPTSPYIPFKSEDGHLWSGASKVRMKTGPGLIKTSPRPSEKLN